MSGPRKSKQARPAAAARWQALQESEARYRELVDNANDTLYTHDLAGRFTSVNRAGELLVGYSREEILGMSIDRLIAPEYLPLAREMIARKMTDREATRYELEIVTKDGRRVRVEVSTRLVVRDGRPVGVQGIARDMTERRRGRAALRDSEAQFRAVFESAPVGIARADAGGRLVAANPVFLDLAGYGGGDDWRGRRFTDHLHPDDVEGPRFAPLCPHLGGAGDRAHLCLPMMAQGKALGILHLAMASSAAPPEARQRFAAMVAEHVALALGNIELSETLRNHSVRDPLTSLFNRRYMEESLERECARADHRKHGLAVVMLDVDEFKRFNDTHGHDAGDALLRAVGALLARHTRGSDIACRYGGEEFTIILPDITPGAAVARVESLRGALGELMVHHLQRTLGPVTASFGVALYPEHGTTTEGLLRAADAALYRAKANGRNRIELATA